jgi:hypothetical protein
MILSALDVPEIAAIEGADVRLVNQANAVTELFHLEPLIAADNLHKQFPSDEKKRVWQPTPHSSKKKLNHSFQFRQRSPAVPDGGTAS